MNVLKELAISLYDFKSYKDFLKTNAARCFSQELFLWFFILP